MTHDQPHSPSSFGIERLNAAIEESRRTVARSRETSERVWVSIAATRLAVEQSLARRATLDDLPLPGGSPAAD